MQFLFFSSSAPTNTNNTTTNTKNQQHQNHNHHRDHQVYSVYIVYSIYASLITIVKGERERHAGKITYSKTLILPFLSDKPEPKCTFFAKFPIKLQTQHFKVDLTFDFSRINIFPLIKLSVANM